MDGIKFSSTYLTLHVVLMEQTTLRPSEFRFMPTAGSAESTFLTDCTQKMNYLPNSNSTSLCNRRNEKLHLHYSSMFHHLYIHSGSFKNQAYRKLTINTTKHKLVIFVLYKIVGSVVNIHFEKEEREKHVCQFIFLW